MQEMQEMQKTLGEASTEDLVAALKGRFKVSLSEELVTGAAWEMVNKRKAPGGAKVKAHEVMESLAKVRSVASTRLHD